MGSHIGDRVLMENLRCDVLDIEETIHKLIKHRDISKSLSTHRSWKYTGSYVLDVDTKNLVNCFQYNPRSADQSQKGHLTLLELLIDRIGASLLAFGVFVELYQTPDVELKTKICTDRNMLVATTECLNLIIRQFIQAWGIGLPPKPETSSEEVQTSDTYRPHDPCPNCQQKKTIRDNIIQTISASLKCDGTDFAERNPALEVNLSELSNTEADAERQEKKLQHSESKLSEEINSATMSFSICENQLTSKKVEFEKLRAHTDYQTKKLNELASEVESTSSSTEKVDLTVSDTYREVTDVNRRIDELEGALAAAKSSGSASDLTHTESRVDLQTKITVNADILSTLTEQLSSLQHTYDPLWQQKIAQSEEKRASLMALWEDSRDRQSRNEHHTKELEEELFHMNSTREKLLAELRSFDTAMV